MWVGGVRVIVFDDDDRLLMIRQHHEDRDIWMVPGGGIYYTMEYCVSGQTSQFIETGIHTFAIAGALAVGVLIVSSLVHLFQKMQLRRRYHHWRKQQS